MKSLKWLSVLSVIPLSLTSVSFCLVSCGKKPQPTPVPEDISEFIYNRTFSLQALNVSKGLCWGTGWIIDDATPDQTNDYQYYIATNWHVIHGFDKLIGEATTVHYQYADMSLKDESEPFIDYSHYINFKSYTQLPLKNYMYQDEESSEFFKKCIDLYVCKVDFGNPTSSIRTKLDTLNSERAEKGYINKFVDGSTNEIQKKNKYIGGFPKKDNGKEGLDFRGGGQWEFHELGNSFTYVSRNNLVSKYWEQEQYQIGHPIGNPWYDQQGNDISWIYPRTKLQPEYYYYYDISPQYVYNNVQTTSWMSGGASGSMMLTQDCEICG
ncbi:MAG: hypothetical protein KBS35_00930, partial [Mycoplasma sp.]|nr:hypothetical protein [Candidatus Hennigella equi]